MTEETNENKINAAGGRSDGFSFSAERKRTERDFRQRLASAGYIALRRYDALKNTLMSYMRADGARMRSHISSSGERFTVGRTTIAAVSVSGKTLKAYFALDPSAYSESRYHHRDMSAVAKHSRCPMMVRLTSDRQTARAAELAREAAEKAGLVCDPTYVPRDNAADIVRGSASAAGRAGTRSSADETAATVAFRIPVHADPSVRAPRGVSLPVRGKVRDAGGADAGTVRGSVWHDGQRRRGEFRRSGGAVLLYDGERASGYMDCHGNVMNERGEYLATVARRRVFPIAVVVLLLAALAAVAVLLGTCPREVSPYAPVLFVADDGASWAETEELPVFENGSTDGKIVPGSSGSYSFRFVNKNAHTVTYSLTFSEVNPYGIDMAYRLFRDGACVSGTDGPVNAAELGVYGLTIESGSSTLFVIEWTWRHSDETDTAAGENEAGYSLGITLTGEILI